MISYPLNLPSSPGFRSAAFTPSSAVVSTRSPFTFHEQVFKWPGQLWSVVITLPAMAITDALAWQSFFTSLNGKEGTFLLRDSPFRLLDPARLMGTPRLAESITNSATVMTKDWPASQTELLKAGDWIQIGGRLRRVLTPAASDAAGNATITVWPYLSGSAENDIITWLNPSGVFRLNEFPSLSFDQRKIQPGFSFSATEAL